MDKEFFRETLSYKIITFLKDQIAEKVDLTVYIFKILVKVIKDILNLRVGMKHILNQAARFGVDSLPLALIIVGVSGMIIALQVTSEMVKQGAVDYIGTLISLVIVREIAPIMGSFAIISMVGSSMAAEIATMKVTEQVDAISVSGVDPVTYLITPRVVAGFFIMPSVIVVATFVGLFGGYFPVHNIADIGLSSYLDSVWLGLYEKDIWVELLKAAVFGTLISLVCASIGYKARGGAIDVGVATTNAVVYSFIVIVITDFLISYAFFY
ncbi:MAG: ABC transporter permease [Candidatus Gastranaerophilales bacterium]|nr:ABC transporter permease [Candidatus Gastranaerophilales bacterium]